MEDLGKTVEITLEEAGVKGGRDLAQKVRNDIEGAVENGTTSNVNPKEAGWMQDFANKDPGTFAKVGYGDLGNPAVMLSDDADAAENLKSQGVSEATANEYKAALEKGEGISEELQAKVDKEIEDHANELANKVDEPALKDAIKNGAERFKKGLYWLGKKVFSKRMLAVYLVLGGVGGVVYVMTSKVVHDMAMCKVRGAAKDAADCTDITKDSGSNSTFAKKVCTYQASSQTCTALKDNTKNPSVNFDGRSTLCSFKTFPTNLTECDTLKQGLGANQASFDGNCCTITGVNKDACDKACLGSCDGKECYKAPPFGKVLACMLNPACFLKDVSNFLTKYMWILYVLLYLTVGTLLYRFFNFIGLTSLVFGSSDGTASVNINLADLTKQQTNTTITGGADAFSMLPLLGQGFMTFGIGLLLLLVTTGEYNSLSNTKKDKETYAYPPGYQNPMAWGITVAVLLLSLMLGMWQGSASYGNRLADVGKYFGGAALLAIGVSQLFETQQMKQTAGVNPSTKQYNSIFTNIGFYASILPTFAYVLGTQV
jgi:hypothetical protein